MTELVIKINNDSILPSLKKILKSISGFVSVKTRKEKPLPEIFDSESGLHLKDSVVQHIVDIKEGKEPTYEAKDAEDLFSQLEA